MSDNLKAFSEDFVRSGAEAMARRSETPTLNEQAPREIYIDPHFEQVMDGGDYVYELTTASTVPTPYCTARYTPAPDTHGHASVEDWLWSEHRIIIDRNPEGWYVTKAPLPIFPTYLAARDAAVAWAEEQEQQDAK